MIVRLLGRVARWVFILCLPVLLITASIAGAINSLWLYKHGFEKYGVSQTTGLSETELEKAARGLISYFNSGEESINISVIKDGKPFVLFNEREVTHLRDVKGLFWLDYWVLLGTFVYTLVYALASLFVNRGKYRRQLAGALFGGSVLTLSLIVAVGGSAAVFGFDRMFLLLHLVSFSNPFWQLDPATDYLIMLVPEGFWTDMALYIVLAIAAGAVVLGAVGGGYRFLKRISDFDENGKIQVSM